MNTMKHKDMLSRVRESFPDDVPAETSERMTKMLAGFRDDLAAHPHWDSNPTRRPNSLRWFAIPDGPERRRLVAYATGIVCITAVLMLLLLNRTPTWADVEAQFGAMKHGTISAYFRKNQFEDPQFAQYWFTADGRARAHISHFVIFFDKGITVRSYDVKTRTEGHPYSAMKLVFRAMERARESGAPDLRSLIRTLASEDIVDTTDLIITDTQVAKDLLVFDARSHDTLWWLRVWTLRESRLPSRILKWHQADGRYVELLFSYSKEQPSRFFDPDAFAERLNDPSINQHGLMNMFLEDPGGKTFPTPGS